MKLPQQGVTYMRDNGKACHVVCVANTHDPLGTEPVLVIYIEQISQRICSIPIEQWNEQFNLLKRGRIYAQNIPTTSAD